MESTQRPLLLTCVVCPSWPTLTPSIFLPIWRLSISYQFFLPGRLMKAPPWSHVTALLFSCSVSLVFPARFPISTRSGRFFVHRPFQFALKLVPLHHTLCPTITFVPFSQTALFLSYILTFPVSAPHTRPSCHELARWAPSQTKFLHRTPGSILSSQRLLR